MKKTVKVVLIPLLSLDIIANLRAKFNIIRLSDMYYVLINSFLKKNPIKNRGTFE